MSPSINKAIQILAREQALHLGDIAKIRRARDTREETRKRGGGDLAASLLARAFLRGSLCSQATLILKLLMVNITGELKSY